MITARAHTNIALIKYWGKRDTTLFLPYTSSLSLTLDAFYTDTSVEFCEGGDEFILNGEKQDEKATKKISHFIDLFRQQAHRHDFVRVVSTNHVPTAAGLASSASAYAALAMALNTLFELHLSRTELSTFSRKGSGSSTRSLFGGFVEWDKGEDDTTSIARPLLAEEDVPCGMIICLINKKKKEISSREGMALTVETSPFFPAFVEASAVDLEEMKLAIADRDVNRIGQIAERNAFRMHATMLGANPPFTYFEPKTIETIQFVKQLRQEGYHCYVTMDAGPNVKVIAPLDELEDIHQKLQTLFKDNELITATAGPKAYLLEKE